MFASQHNPSPNTFKLALSFDDVLLVPKYSTINSRSEVNLETKISSNLTLKMPIISTNMNSVTGLAMAIKMSELGGMGILPRFEAAEQQAEKVAQIASKGAIAAASIGIKPGSMERAELLVNAGAKVLNIDVAHGHMEQNINFTREIKNKFMDNITLISGICATGECANDLFNAGADSVFVGVGGGSICTTRIQTGSGLPTFDSLLRISAVARKYNKTFIPCAGLKNSGDIVKSLAAGASAVAVGSMLAGTDETPGEIIEIEGKKYKKYNGSTSVEEKNYHIQSEPQNKSESYNKHIEGVSGYVPYKGSVEELVELLLAGVKSGFSYSGARNLNELWSNAEFVQITSQGKVESGAHDIVVIN